MNAKEKIEAWIKDWTYLFPLEPIIIKKLRDKNFNDDQIVDVLEIIGDTCLHCFNSDSGCQCWNDE